MQPGTMVPINWIAIGNPAEVFPPDEYEEIWAIQKTVNFPEFIYVLDREEAQPRVKIMESHKQDQTIS